MAKDVETNIAPERTDWTRMRVVEVACERNLQYEGHPVSRIAEMMGKEPLDAFLDLALDEDLETLFNHPAADPPEGDRILDPHAHISTSDGGAHTRFLVGTDWPVEFLSHWIRDKELMSLEQAHYKMSAYPAWVADFNNRRHASHRCLGRHHRLRTGPARLSLRRASLCKRLPRRRAADDPEASGTALHAGQRHRDLRGERVQRRPSGKASAQLRHAGLNR